MNSSLNESDWQSFVYLAVLLVFLLTSVVARRDMPFKKTLKYLAAWSGIGLIVIILYSYRFEFTDFKNRILGEINPSLVRTKESGQLVIKLSEDGHFYMNIRINGKKIRFMVDTGASDIVISASDARKIGINLKKLTFNRSYQTANGRSWGASVRLKEVEVGGVKLEDVSASVNSGDMGISLLGMSFLRQFSKYEFYRDELVLTI